MLRRSRRDIPDRLREVVLDIDEAFQFDITWVIKDAAEVAMQRTLLREHKRRYAVAQVLVSSFSSLSKLEPFSRPKVARIQDEVIEPVRQVDRIRPGDYLVNFGLHGVLVTKPAPCRMITIWIYKSTPSYLKHSSSAQARYGQIVKDQGFLSTAKRQVVYVQDGNSTTKSK